jgi:tetratricopeptide (TPR) repeat protein
MKSSGDEEQSQAFLQEAFALDPHDPRLEGKVEGWTPASEEAPAEAAAVDNSEALTEADFHMQQGFYKDAADIYRRLLDSSPGDAAIAAKLDEAESKLAEAGPAEADLSEEQVEPAKEAQLAAEPKKEEETVVPFAGEAEEGLFDFSSILDSEDIQEPAVGSLDTDVQDIFNEFKKGLSMEVEAEDSSTHYDLGIAYKEMGILDDAIKEFQTAQRDPEFYSQCMSMIGFCYMEKGAFSLAVDAFSSALMKTDLHDEKRWSLKYDLAEAYEKDGNPNEALQMYMDVKKWNPTFREVSKKVDQLSGGAPPSTPVEPLEKPSETPPQPEAKTPKDKKSRVSYI